MDDMERVVESGAGFFSGPGVKTASKAKTKNGDQSVAMAGAMGPAGASWMSLLDDGSDNPYPITSQAIKTKNTRKNNDSFSG
jgi:hypothetical protein